MDVSTLCLTDPPEFLECLWVPKVKDVAPVRHYQLTATVGHSPALAAATVAAAVAGAVAGVGSRYGGDHNIKRKHISDGIAPK